MLPSATLRRGRRLPRRVGPRPRRVGEGERRRRLRVAAHSVEAEARGAAPVVTPPAVERVHVRVDAYTPAALPREAAPHAAQAAVVDVGADVHAAVPAAAPPDPWGVAVADPRPLPAAEEPRVHDPRQPRFVGCGVFTIFVQASCFCLRKRQKQGHEIA